MLFIVFLFLFVNLKNSYADVPEFCNEFWENFDINRTHYEYYNYMKVVGCKSVTTQLNLQEIYSQAPKIWKFNLTTEDSFRFSFNLQKVDSVVFDEHTKVYSAQNNVGNNIDDTKYVEQNIYSVASKLKNVAVYHDVDNDYPAALVLYESKYGMPVMEGFVGNYSLRYVHSSSQYILYRISIDNDLIINPNAAGLVSNVDNFKLNSNQYPDKAYVSLLVALDSSFVVDRQSSDVLKDLLLYYNAVDLTYSKFTSPKIKIHIRGVIIPQNNYSVPYLQKFNNILKLPEHYSKQSYFVNNSKSGIFSSYKNVIVMSGLKFLKNADEPDRLWAGYGFKLRTSNGLFFSEDIIRHPNFFGDYFIAAHIISNLLWKNAQGELSSKCQPYYSVLNRYYNKGCEFLWCKCDVEEMSEHFNFATFANYYKYPNKGPLKTQSNLCITLVLFIIFYNFSIYK